MENPKFKGITTGTPITIQGPRGPVVLKALKATRGQGSKQYCLTIEGLLSESLAFSDQCEIQFSGGQSLGNFEWCRPTNAKNGYVGVFKTIISDPAFWE